MFVRSWNRSSCNNQHNDNHKTIWTERTQIFCKWHCILRCLAPDISDDHVAFIVKFNLSVKNRQYWSVLVTVLTARRVQVCCSGSEKQRCWKCCAWTGDSPATCIQIGHSRGRDELCVWDKCDMLRKQGLGLLLVMCGVGIRRWHARKKAQKLVRNT